VVNCGLWIVACVEVERRDGERLSFKVEVVIVVQSAKVVESELTNHQRKRKDNPQLQLIQRDLIPLPPLASPFDTPCHAAPRPSPRSNTSPPRPRHAVSARPKRGMLEAQA